MAGSFPDKVVSHVTTVQYMFVFTQILSNSPNQRGYATNWPMAFPNLTTIHITSYMRWKYSPTQEPQWMIQNNFNHLRTRTGTSFFHLLHPNIASFVVLMSTPTLVKPNSTLSWNKYLLYLEPIAKIVTSSINWLRTLQKWIHSYADEGSDLSILKKKLYNSGVRNLLQQKVISYDVPWLKTISFMSQTTKWTPVAKIYILRCGQQIGGGKCRQVLLYCQRNCFMSDFHCVWVS